MRTNSNYHATVALHQMIEQLAISSLPSTIQRKSFILNNIPGEMYVHTDIQKLAAVLGAILHTMLSQTQEGCIRISAKPYGNVILVHINDNCNHHGPAFNTNIGQAQDMAEKIGGSVTVNNFRKDMTTIALSFMNLPLAA